MNSGRLHLLGALECLFDTADVEERILGKLVACSVEDHLEATDRILEFDVFARITRELLGDEERLREEFLDLSGPGNGQFVVVRKLVHTKDVDDILKIFVGLQRFFHSFGHAVVLIAHDAGFEDP